MILLPAWPWGWSARQRRNSNVAPNKRNVEENGRHYADDGLMFRETGFGKGDSSPYDGSSYNAEDRPITTRGRAFAHNINDVENDGDDSREKLGSADCLEYLRRKLVFDFLLIFVEHIAGSEVMRVWTQRMEGGDEERECELSIMVVVGLATRKQTQGVQGSTSATCDMCHTLGALCISTQQLEYQVWLVMRVITIPQGSCASLMSVKVSSAEIPVGLSFDRLK